MVCLRGKGSRMFFFLEMTNCEPWELICRAASAKLTHPVQLPSPFAAAAGAQCKSSCLASSASDSKARRRYSWSAWSSDTLNIQRLRCKEKLKKLKKTHITVYYTTLIDNFVVENMSLQKKKKVSAWFVFQRLISGTHWLIFICLV